MATFARENARFSRLYIRRTLPSGDDVFGRMPYNLVEYDDGSGAYVEPTSWHAMSNFTFYDVNTPGTEGTFLFVDKPPFSGVTEIY